MSIFEAILIVMGIEIALAIFVPVTILIWGEVLDNSRERKEKKRQGR